MTTVPRNYPPISRKYLEHATHRVRHKIRGGGGGVGEGERRGIVDAKAVRNDCLDEGVPGFACLFASGIDVGGQ